MKRCKGCYYSFIDLSSNPHDYYCEYILKTGVPRGCPVEDCDKWVDRKKRISNNTWKLINAEMCERRKRREKNE